MREQRDGKSEENGIIATFSKRRVQMERHSNNTLEVSKPSNREG